MPLLLLLLLNHPHPMHPRLQVQQLQTALNAERAQSREHKRDADAALRSLESSREQQQVGGSG